jgi:hypothetical protein
MKGAFHNINKQIETAKAQIDRISKYEERAPNKTVIKRLEAFIIEQENFGMFLTKYKMTNQA